MPLTTARIEFRRLMTVVLAAGTAAGLLLAALQFFTVEPLIHAAEIYEHAGAVDAAEAAHDHEGWQPSEGLERITYTVLGTVLTGIAFSALLFGVASLLGLELHGRRGLWLGLAGFACFALGPALGLPPRPPGVIGAELHAAQVWWAASVLATAIGLWAITRVNGTWAGRVAGAICLLAPHLYGAPQALAAGNSTVPLDLIRRFAVLSLATQGAFWLLLGGFGGYLYSRLVSRAWDQRTGLATAPAAAPRIGSHRPADIRYSRIRNHSSGDLGVAGSLQV